MNSEHQEEETRRDKSCAHTPKRRKLAIGGLSRREPSSSSSTGSPNTQNDNLTEHEWTSVNRTDAKNEFTEVMKNWIEWEPDWPGLYPNSNFGEELDVIKDLKDLDMKVLLTEAKKLNDKDNRFGHLLTMCNATKFQLGALISQSFAERMNSAGNNIVTENRSSLGNETIDKLAILRMNRRFIDHCRKQKATARNKI